MNRKEKTHRKKRIGFLLAVVLLLAALVQGNTILEAANKQTTKRVIALVFDNSGSMYQETAWCQAIYAMEVFASMANEGDQIRIYPMHDIEANGKTYTSKAPLTVEGGSDVSVIRQIYTPKAGGTPMETIDDAYDDLMNTTADEKWLIVLTDGEEFDGYTHSETESELTSLLSKYNQSVNLMYLGIGSGAAKPTISGSYQNKVEITKNTSDVLESLTEMCNAIYGRDQLTTSKNTVTFDLSMNKLILFVQGSDIKNLKLTDASGNSVGTLTNSYTPSYSTTGCGNNTAYYKNMASDTSLSGVIAAYEDVPAGTYTLDYDGNANNISVYYEPNVSITAFLVNEDGVNISDAGDDIYPGSYQLQYGLVDENGNLTDSKLLGERKFTINWSVNGENFTETKNENGSIEIELKEGDEIEALVEATYLSGYYVSTENQNDWPFPLTIQPWPAYTLTGSVSGGETSYEKTELEEKGIYHVTLSYDGNKLTGDELSKAQLSASVGGENAPEASVTLSDDGESYVISLGYPGGDAAALGTGSYTLAVQASYTDENGTEVSADIGSKEFEISEYSYDLQAKIDAKSYYVISQMEKENPVYINVTHDGEPLTAEAMENVSLALDADGLDYTVEKDAENSRFLVYLNAEMSDQGRHKLSATVSACDDLGQMVSAQTDKTVDLQKYPLWLRILPWILLLILLFILWTLWRNQKLLPKDIIVVLENNGGNSAYMVGSKQITGYPVLSGYEGNRKTAKIKISGSDPITHVPDCYLTLNLEAVDPRKQESSARKARVTNFNASPNVTSFSVGSVTFDRDAKGQWKDENGVIQTFPLTGQNITIGNNDQCNIMGKDVTGTNIKKSLNMHAELIFE